MIPFWLYVATVPTMLFCGFAFGLLVGQRVERKDRAKREHIVVTEEMLWADLLARGVNLGIASATGLPKLATRSSYDFYLAKCVAADRKSPGKWKVDFVFRDQ